MRHGRGGVTTPVAYTHASSATRTAVPTVVNDREVHARTAMREAQARRARTDDGDLDAGSESYVVGGCAPEGLAHAFVTSTDKDFGGQATFDRASSFIDGFELAPRLAHGTQPRRHEFRNEIRGDQGTVGQPSARGVGLRGDRNPGASINQVFLAAQAARASLRACSCFVARWWHDARYER